MGDKFGQSCIFMISVGDNTKKVRLTIVSVSNFVYFDFIP